jgi:hypothetical protein
MQIDRIIDLLVLTSNTSALLRLKVALVGFGALMAGLFFMASGIEGSTLRGGLMAACGAGLIGIACLCFRERTIEEAAAPEKVVTPGMEPEPPSSCDHDWVDQDEMLNYDPKYFRCSKCGEGRFA